MENWQSKEFLILNLNDVKVSIIHTHHAHTYVFDSLPVKTEKSRRKSFSQFKQKSCHPFIHSFDL